MTTKKTSENLEVLRHSTSHVLAASVLEMFPEAKFAIGPAIENGFYYDFDLPRTLIPEDLEILEEKMRAIIKANYQFERAEISTSEARADFKKLAQDYKVELIDELEKAGNTNVSIYKSDSFVDLYSGPHLDSTGEIPADGFKLTKISGAYWRGDEKNKQLQRIYGVAFASKVELKDYLHMLEEAEKRDHRKIGKELDLFVFSDLVGPGLPLYTHKGATIRREIIKYSNELQIAIGYQEVHTPNINKAELFKVSGHYEKYKEDMLRVVSNYTDEEYFLKPMNCPQHTQIFASRMRSYKDLPIRISDFANLYRDEKPGELSGLTRLRCFCQDDGHSFCREDQIREEFVSVLGAIQKAMKTYGLEYKIRLSLWDPQKPEKYLGDPAVWENSQKLLEEILIENKIEYAVGIGEAAIYGPKMDLIAKDSLGREWQLSTIQLDFIMPKRFELEYIDSNGEKKTPVMVHRAITGSPERFLGVLIEHYAGAFPTWLSPVQVMIVPISEKFNDYAKSVETQFIASSVRTSIDDSNESLGKRIRLAEKQKIPYILVVGEKEMTDGTVAIRKRGEEKKQEILKVEEFSERIKKEIDEKL
ncbi:MAG: threonine--tRNA ligase [Parcubacteria group bacterium]|jgi:threonyl-tRNA synthetase